MNIYNLFLWSVFCICLLFPVFTYSQGEWNNWYFGAHAGISFNSGNPVAVTNCAPSFTDAYCPSTVSDSSGTLLFYAGIYNTAMNMNGTVYNKINQIMPNGQFLYTGWDTKQNYVSVQKLDDDSSYYLFTMDEESTPSYTFAKGLTYSLIDMRLDGGLGDIVSGQKSIQVPGAEYTRDMLTCTRHSNNRDVWVTVRNYMNSSSYLTYLITSAGINPVPVISNSYFNLVYPVPNGGLLPKMIRFSPDGTKLICLYSDSLEYCQFNSSTGQITPLFKLLYNSYGYTSDGPNAEFSVNSHYLYIFDQYRGEINQYDATRIDSLQFLQSKMLIATTYNYDAWLQRGPDNKIYFSLNVIDSLGVIGNPNVQGSGCNYQRDAVFLAGNNCMDGLPQFLQRYYVYIQNSNVLCSGLSTHFTSSIWPPADSIHWDFGDPASGPSNFSFLPNPSHTYFSSGSYTVKLFVRHNDNRTDTTWQTITILTSPLVALGPDRTICTGDSTTFNAGPCIGCTYLWKDLGSGLTVGTAQTYKTGQVGTYAVIVTNSNNCIGTDTIQLQTTPVPSVTNNPLSKSICSGESTNISLTANVPGATFHWTATLTSGNISGFSADSGLVINQVLTNSLSTPGIVTYHITPKVGSCVGNTVDFPVSVNPGDSVKVSISASTNNICAGTAVTFTATPTNGGITPSYQWKVNGINVGPDNYSYTFNPASGDMVSCVLTSSIIVCISNNPATSNTIQMIVNPLNPVGVSISPSANPVCSGTAVTFTATPVHGGTTPVYQWKVNGLIVGTNNPMYSYTPVNGDIATCILTSNILCPTGNPTTSNTIIMTVNPNLPVSVSITASANPFCQGSQVTFTATPTYGGITPSYQWKVNGIGVGPNNPVYSYFPNSGDIVSCVLSSSETCTTNNPALSNQVIMVINSNLPVGVSIASSSNPFCPGNSVTFTATPVNGGSTPGYQWKVNGANSGTNSSIFTYNPISGDLVSCILTSNLACVTGNPATSNTIIMSGTLASMVTFTACFDTITTTNAQPFKLKGGIPLGGTYSGVGVAGGIFNPVIAGVGSHQITYTYTNAALCSANAHSFLHIFNSSNLPCGSLLTDIRDNKVYPTVQIGSQCWMAANLDYGTMIPGNTSQRDNCIWEKYCYNDVIANCGQQSYYQWDELMQYDETVSTQGFCPPGWHIPTEADWNKLFTHYINNGFAGSPLKYSGFSGFNALFNGARHLNRQWDYPGFATFFWSSTAHGALKAWSHGMNDPDPSVSAYPAFRTNAFSVRCIRDN